jgi:hypothetical protein
VVDAAAEDQADLVRAAEIQVVADHLLQEDPPGDRPVEHLGEAELRLHDGGVVAVPGGGVVLGERVRQDPQPLGQQRPDLLLAERIADPLQRGHVIDRGEGVVQRGEADPCLLRLPLRPVIGIKAQLGGIGEVAAELDEERAEILIHAIEIEVVDLQRGPGQPQVLRPGRRVAALLGTEHPGLLLGAADEQHPLPAGEVSQVPVRDRVLVLALAEGHQVQPPGRDEVMDVRHERLGDRRHQHRRRVLVPPVADEERRDPAAILQSRLVDVEVHPVDRLDLEDHVARQDISCGAR